METKPQILCIDDEVDNVDAMERLLRKKYHVLKAYSGAEAIEILKKNTNPIPVIITDQRMPGMTGIEFLEQTLSTHPNTIRMLLTGYTDLESVISAINKGQIYRYLTKPWDPVDLGNTVDRAVERFQMSQELKQKTIELEKAFAELKTLDTAKSNFMILVNHELKTPLTSILNFTALLNETNLTEEQKLFANRIELSGERLKSLIDDVLLIVKSEIGQLKMDLRPTLIPSLNELITTSIDQLVKDKKIKINSKKEDTKVLADANFLRQLLIRIFHNAAKFCHENSEITLETKKVANKLHISISNYGPMINENAIDKVFRPFFIDENIMNHSAGVGLGLTICQSILVEHKSGLSFKNNPDGVSVSFELQIA